MSLIVYKNDLVTNTVIMHLSCKCSWWTFLGTYSTYVLLQADSACKNVRNLVHDVVPWKRYVLQGTWSFRMFCHFWNGLSVVCFSVGLAVVRRPADTFHVELVRASVCTLIFTIMHAIIFCDRMQDRTNNLFSRSRVWTPGLARDRFLWVQGLNPCPCGTIFSWVQGSTSWPWSPVCRPDISLAYVTRPHEWSNRWHRRKKTLIRGKKNLSAWVVALAVWGSRKVSTCD